MEELVAEEEEEEISAAYSSNNDITITLPKLKNFHLSKVDKLKKICGKVLVCTSMVSIHLEGCPKLQKIPFSVGTSSVEFKGVIEGTRKWWDKLQWDDPATKPLLLPLFEEEEYDDADEEDDDDDDCNEDHDDDSDDDDDSNEDDDDDSDDAEDGNEDDNDDDCDNNDVDDHNRKEASEKEETTIATTKEEGTIFPMAK